MTHGCGHRPYGYLPMFRQAALWSALTFSLNVWSHGTENHSTTPAADTTQNVKAVVLAPGYEYLEYDAPVPGSYSLPAIGKAGDGEVLDSQGVTHTLHSLMADKITVLSFIYQACDDVNGCPLATFVMSKIRERLAQDPQMHDAVQLLSMSFDPVSDTPESMAAYAKGFGTSEVSWQFLTAASEEAIAPVLDDYGQSVSRKKIAGDATTINHVLRVYVIDPQLQIRNIYNSSLLHADSLISDIYTLSLGGESTPLDGIELAADNAATDSEPASLVTDDRSGYASGDYVSQSSSVSTAGVSGDLLAHARKPSAGLPQLPRLDELTAEKIALGKKLFFDRRLSINNTFSCAMCHLPEQGFTANELSMAVGVEGRTVKRNAPTLLNIGFLDTLFHDGREFSLENQVWSPLLAHNEMANPSIGYVLRKIESIEGYPDAFLSAYGDAKVDMNRIGDALASYERTLIAGNSSFDQWFYSGRESAVGAEVKAGFELFTGKAGCSVCHTVGDDHALFTDQKLHNTGVGYARSMKKKSEPHLVTLAPGVVVEIDPAVYADAAETPPNDLGLYEVTQDPDDRWKFRTPTLRNITLTAPYMHDGSIGTLEEVIRFYEAGGIPNPTQSVLLKPFTLSTAERRGLISFLSSLTSPDVPMLRADALSTPVGDL